MAYNSVTHSIPPKWKHIIKENKSKAGQDTLEQNIFIGSKYRSLEEITTKEVYDNIRNGKMQRPTSEKRWVELYNDLVLEEQDWEMIYTTTRSLTKDSKIQMFQYKITNRILATNKNLKKWKRISYDKCEFCNDIDTMEHFLYECRVSMKLWDSIQLWWESSLSFKFPITVLEIFFGIPNENRDNITHICNYIIMQAKYLLYVSKKSNNLHHIDLYNLLLVIKNDLHLKRTYAIENNRLKTYEKNWNELECNL